jgi:hypothetical protein
LVCGPALALTKAAKDAKDQKSEQLGFILTSLAIGGS